MTAFVAACLTTSDIPSTDDFPSMLSKKCLSICKSLLRNYKDKSAKVDLARYWATQQSVNSTKRFVSNFDLSSCTVFSVNTCTAAESCFFLSSVKKIIVEMFVYGPTVSDVFTNATTG